MFTKFIKATIAFMFICMTTHPAAAKGLGSLYVTNESTTSICSMYITPSGESASDTDLLSAGNIGCLEPGMGAWIQYGKLSDCYVFVETLTKDGEMFFSNGIDLCTQKELPIFSGNDSSDNGQDVQLVGGSAQLGYLEINNKSSQDICQVYFSSLRDNASDDDMVMYQAGNNGDCLAPGQSRVISYDLADADCGYQVTLETGFIEQIFDEQVDLCTRSEISITDK